MVYTLFGSTVLIALCSVILLIQSTGKKITSSWHGLLVAFALAVFIYLYGAWVYLSVYLKYFFGLIWLLIFCTGLLKKKEEIRVKKWKIIPNIFFSCLLGILSILYFTGTMGKPKTVELSFPLRTGKYFVLQGGKGLPTNFFHYSYRGAVYAMDLVKLNKFGNRANKIFSNRLEDYEIFNDTIYSPCDGKILIVKDENPDNIPPSRTRGPSNTNSVLIATDSFYVFMAHLKQEGVFVKQGDQVKTGQPIGLVGNSGFSLEPHLHLQAHKNTGKNDWYHEEPLYIKFDGKSYLLFETISPQKKE